MIDSHVADSGWIVNNNECKAPINAKKELLYALKGFTVEVLVLPIFAAFVCMVWIKSKIINNRSNKILFGTNSVISLKTIKSALNGEFDITYFVFKDYFHILDDVVPVTINDVCPRFIANNYPTLIGKYFAFIWAIKNFQVFVLYFNGGFLDKTFFMWRLEPIIYQLLGKKFAMLPYGEDVWDTRKNLNIYHKYGHLVYNNLYFNDDFKREQRVYWWCKYANLVFAPVEYLRYIPRVDILTLTGHVLKIELHPYSFKSNGDKIKILHFANQGARKGSMQIRAALEKIASENESIEYLILDGVERKVAIKAMEDCHIFIDNLIDGVISYSGVEAMLSGKIVIAKMDKLLNEFYTSISPKFYNKFLEECPIVNTDIANFEPSLRSLTKQTGDFQTLSLNSRRFAERLIENSLIGWREFLKQLIEFK